MTSHHHLQQPCRKNENADNEPVYESRAPSAWERTQEFMIATSIGQFVLRKAYETLRTTEQTVKWRCSVNRGAPQPKLIRPLPWVLFFPALIMMRMAHIVVQVIYRLRGYPAPQAEDIVRYLQRCQRHVRCLRYVGTRIMRYQGPGMLSKIRAYMVCPLRTIFEWFGLVVSAERKTELQEHRATQTNRSTAKRHKANDEDSIEKVQEVDETADNILHDLLYKEYPSDSESDLTFVVDSSSEMESSAYQTISDSDGSNYHGGEKRARKQKLRSKNNDNYAICTAETPKSTVPLRPRKHIPNESSSGVESMDTRAPPPTAEHSLSSVMSDDDEKDDMYAKRTGYNRSGVSPAPGHTVIHSGTPDTPTITVSHYEENNSEANSSFVLNVSSILSETVALRSIENTSQPASFSDPEMSKSKRRRLKKKSQLKQQLQQQNKEN